ncbi:MAG: type II toxin-antitoxin system RatA family toxin [Solirubrobacteraceae bacterium]
MTVISGTATGEVEAPLERCWSLIEDVLSAPEWQSGLESMDVVERDEAGRAVVCDTISDAKLRKVKSRVRFSYDGPTRLSWQQIDDGDLRSLEGDWQLEPLGDGRTRVTYSLAVDPGPVPRLARIPFERAARAFLLNPRPKELAEQVE